MAGFGYEPFGSLAPSLHFSVDCGNLHSGANRFVCRHRYAVLGLGFRCRESYWTGCFALGAAMEFGCCFLVNYSMMLLPIALGHSHSAFFEPVPNDLIACCSSFLKLLRWPLSEQRPFLVLSLSLFWALSLIFVSI